MDLDSAILHIIKRSTDENSDIDWDQVHGEIIKLAESGYQLGVSQYLSEMYRMGIGTTPSFEKYKYYQKKARLKYILSKSTSTHIINPELYSTNVVLWSDNSQYDLAITSCVQFRLVIEGVYLEGGTYSRRYPFISLADLSAAKDVAIIITFADYEQIKSRNQIDTKVSYYVVNYNETGVYTAPPNVHQFYVDNPTIHQNKIGDNQLQNVIMSNSQNQICFETDQHIPMCEISRRFLLGKQIFMQEMCSDPNIKVVPWQSVGDITKSVAALKGLKDEGYKITLFVVQNRTFVKELFDDYIDRIVLITNYQYRCLDVYFTLNPKMVDPSVRFFIYGINTLFVSSIYRPIVNQLDFFKVAVGSKSLSVARPEIQCKTYSEQFDEIDDAVLIIPHSNYSYARTEGIEFKMKMHRLFDEIVNWCHHNNIKVYANQGGDWKNNVKRINTGILDFCTMARRCRCVIGPMTGLFDILSLLGVSNNYVFFRNCNNLKVYDVGQMDPTNHTTCYVLGDHDSALSDVITYISSHSAPDNFMTSKENTILPYNRTWMPGAYTDYIINRHNHESCCIDNMYDHLGAGEISASEHVTGETRVTLLRSAGLKNRANLNYALEQLYSLKTECADSTIVELCDAYIACNDYVAYRYMGLMFWQGRSVNKNLNLAASYLRISSSMGSIEAKHDLLTVLYQLSTKESLEEYHDILCSELKFNDGVMMFKLGVAYHDGKGVEKDLQKAAELMRAATVNGAPWAKDRLADVLWDINTDESIKELIPILKERVALGKGRAMFTLGKAYYYGRGVEKDLQKAAELMRAATVNGAPWAEKLLNEILQQKKT